MIRITATHIATCADCRDKAAQSQLEPCMKHAAEARGMRFSGWRPIPPTAWDRALERQPTPSPSDGVPNAWQSITHSTNDPWKAHR